MMVAATEASRTFWFLTRASGIVALVLLTAVVVLGVVVTAGWSSPRWPRFVSQGLHRNLTLMALAMLVLHIVTTVADGFAPIGFVDAFVPFHSPYRPIWLGMGALSFDLLVAVTLTSLVRRHIGYRIWKAVHWASYAMWPLAVLHGLGTGTDTRLSPVLFVNLACAVAVLGAIGWRLSLGWPQRSSERVLLAIGSLAGAVAIAAFTAIGPLRPGWALRAGTPVSLLQKLAGAPVQQPAGNGVVQPNTSSVSSPTVTQSPTTSTLPGNGFEAGFTGTISQSSPDSSGYVTVTITGQLSGGPAGTLTVSLTGPPDPGGGLSVVSSSVSFGSSRGQVVSLEGERLIAGLTDPQGNQFIFDIRLRIDVPNGTVTGTVVGSPPGSSGLAGEGAHESGEGGGEGGRDSGGESE